MSRARSAAILVLAGLLLCGPAALAASQITWEDLMPPMEPGADPYEGLTPEQQEHLYNLFIADGQRQMGFEVDPGTLANETESLAALAADGLDGRALVEKEHAFQALIERQRGIIRPEWDGEEIRIPGYVLPLEYKGERVTEFVLVPYVGACIHTPPPPPNQMILVKTDEGLITQGLFHPVWVEGRLAVAQNTRAVDLSDGTSSFEVGYALEATEVVDYVE